MRVCSRRREPGYSPRHMEPIDLELADRKARLRRMAIELQRLEAVRPLGKMEDWDEHDRKIIGLRYDIEHTQWGIRDLEAIIAERHAPPPRISRPDTSRRRELSPEERQAIEDATRADLHRTMPDV